MSEQPLDNAEASTASNATDDKDAVSSAGEELEELDGSEVIAEEDPTGKPVDGETEGETSEDEPEDPQVILTRNTQKRFDEFASDIRDLKAENAQLRQKPTLDVSGLQEPKPSDFEDGEEDPAYLVAQGEYKGAIKALTVINKSNLDDANAQAVHSFNQKKNTYLQKAVDVKKEMPDFEAVVKGTMLDAVDAQGNYTEATIALLEIENGPQVAYHLAKNPNIAMSLNRSTPTQVAMAIGRLSNELSASPAKPKKHDPPIESEDTGAGPGGTDENLPHLGKATFE